MPFIFKYNISLFISYIISILNLLFRTFIILLNVILTGFLAVSIKRPIIYYEYIFLPLVFVIIQKHLYKVLLLLGLILLDISYNVSHLYYFDIFNYFEKLPYLLIAKFEISLYIKVIFSFGFNVPLTTRINMTTPT